MKETVEHTPLPWKANCFGIYSETTQDRIAHTGGQLIPPGPRSQEAEANAQYIVTACNAHKGLVEALKLARKIIKPFTHEADCSDAPGDLIGADYQCQWCTTYFQINKALTLARKGL